MMTAFVYSRPWSGNISLASLNPPIALAELKRVPRFLAKLRQPRSHYNTTYGKNMVNYRYYRSRKCKCSIMMVNHTVRLRQPSIIHSPYYSSSST